MIEVYNIDECLVELAPYGSFPAWGLKEIKNTELPATRDEQLQISIF